MATTEYEGGTGGKFRKRPLRRVPPTPYDRPPSAARGPPPLAVAAGGSGWLSKIVDPASRVITRSATRLFSSVFRKRLASHPEENFSTIEDIPEVKSSPAVREQCGNPVDARLSIHSDGSSRSEQELISGTDAIFKLEQLLRQKRFSRAETERLTELLHSRTIEPSTLPSADYKNKGKVDEDSNIDPSSSQKAVNYKEKGKEKKNTLELEGQREQLVRLQGNVTSGVNVNIPEEGFGSPIEIARAYMDSKPLKATPFTLGSQNQICHRDKVSPWNLPFGNKPFNAAIGSRSALCFPVIPSDSGNDGMNPKLRGRSALYKLSRSPYCRSLMMTKPREYSPYKDSNIGPTRSLEWSPSLSNVKHPVHGQVLKRGSSDSDAGCFADTRRVRQKSCFKDLNLSTRADTSSTSFLGQGYRHDIDVKGLENVDGRIPSTSILHVPPQSTEMARKILHQLDRLNRSPQNKSSEKKVVFGDASLSKSSLSAFHEGPLKIKDNNESTRLVNVRRSNILDGPSSSSLARITSSASPNKDKAKEEASPISSISGAEVAPSCFGINSVVTSASDMEHSMRTTDLYSHGFASHSMQKEPTVQSVTDGKVDSTKAEHAFLVSVKEPREKSVVHSLEYVPTSGLMHTVTDKNDHDKASPEKDVTFKFLAASASNTLSKPLLFSSVATASGDGASSEGDTVCPLQFGFKGSTDNATKPVNTGIGASVRAGETIVDQQTSEAEKGVSYSLFGNTGSYASSSNLFSSSAVPTFQFGSGNSTIYSFTGLPAVSSSTGNGTPEFQFGSGNLTCYSFTGAPAVSSSTGSGLSNPVLSSLYSATGGSNSLSTSSVLPISANGDFGVSSFTSSSSQNTARNVASSLSTSSSSSGASLGSNSSNCSISPAVPASFSLPTSAFSSSSFFGATLGPTATPLRPPQTPFSFGPSIGTSTSAASQALFGLTASTTGFGSGSPSNDEMNVDDSSRADNNFQAAPVPPAPTLGLSTDLQSAPSGAQVFEFGTFQNHPDSSPFQASENRQFSAGGSFSLGSGGAEKSQRKFIRVKRDKPRKK